jgi:AraC-like DNA-binding protein
MLHREIEAPDELRDVIKCFWHNRRDFGAQPSNFEVMPDGYAEIIFHFGGPCSVADHPLPSPFLMGLLNQPVQVTAQGRFDIIGVRCFPWTVFDLLGLPSGGDEVRVFDHPIAQLQPGLEQLMLADRADDAVAMVMRYFLGARVAADGTLSKAGLALRSANGALPVSEVAAAAHATVRTLERKFLRSAGRTIKDVSGLMRFEQARNHLWRHPQANLAALAQALGYTDQSHLSKEFKRYSGVTPGAFARKAKGGAPADIVAFVQSQSGE